MLVKICGLKTKAAAAAAAKAGADFLGFNFVPGSKRKIQPASARKIITTLQKDRRIIKGNRSPKFVGVFMDQSDFEIKSILSRIPLDLLQFHGSETPEFCEQFKLPYIKAIGVDTKDTAEGLSKKMKKYRAKYFLLDRKERGQGLPVELRVVRRLAKRFPVFLAGGLTPENLKERVARSGPIQGVDVAGGVEKYGRKDAGKIKLFIRNLSNN